MQFKILSPDALYTSGVLILEIYDSATVSIDTTLLDEF